MRERCEGGGGLAPGCDGKAGGDQCVLDLEGAGKRQANRMIDTGMGNLQHLREAFERNLAKADALASPSYGEQAEVAPLRGRDHDPRVLVVGGDHRRAVRLDQIGE